MPIQVIYEKRCHLGEEDISYPAFFCDACGDRIAEVKDGAYYWKMPTTGQDPYKTPSPILFFHYECSRKVASAAKQNANILSPYGLLETQGWERPNWMPLDHFTVYLGRNCNMQIAAETTGPRDYQPRFIPKKPPKAPGVYFLVESESIRPKVKVGHSLNIAARIKELQTGSPCQLKFYGCVVGTLEDEGRAHSLLDFCRSRPQGEWFYWDEAQPKIDEWIDEGKIPTD